jgi:hypothetical protein
MPVMNMSRDFTISTTSGHTVIFKSGVDVHVPDVVAVIESCLKYGAKFVDKKEEAKVLAPTEETPKTRMTSADRRKAIAGLFKTMADNQEEHRTHFTSTGKPSVDYVKEALGFDVPAGEIDSHWKAFLQKK